MEEFQHPTLLDSINSVITPEFTKLSGLEFNYDKDSMVNYTIFKDFLCMDCSSIDYTEFVLLARRKLQNKKNNFLDIKAQLESN
jgi:hypothetical protein